MEQLKDYADARLIQGCIYCGASADTREHVPSKILLDKLFPTNLPVMPACVTCNNGFSKDEEYVACIISCMLSESTDPSKIVNIRTSKTLSRKPALRAQLEDAKYVQQGKVRFKVDEGRLVNIIRKLAVGHAAFELSKVLRTDPFHLNWWLVSSLKKEESDEFDASYVTELLGEVGSRNTQRLLVTEVVLQASDGELKKIQLLVDDWVDVQGNVYRYHAIETAEGILVKIVFSEYLACEVFWKDI